jgi:hypothetical protein
MSITFTGIIAAQEGVSKAIAGAEQAWSLVAPNGKAAIFEAVYAPIFATVKRVDEDYRRLLLGLLKKLDSTGELAIKAQPNSNAEDDLARALKDWKALQNALAVMRDDACVLRPLRRQLLEETTALLDGIKPSLWPWSAKNYERKFLIGVAAYFLYVQPIKTWKREVVAVSNRLALFDIKTGMQNFDTSATELMEGSLGNVYRGLLYERAHEMLKTLGFWYKTIVKRYSMLSRVFSK